jgi:D-glucosaminate-6-phosphate ammonia-lyase
MGLKNNFANSSNGTNVDPYRELGVRPFINCCGTRTVHGGSLILPEVQAAMAAAASQFVNLNELMDRARLRIAELTGAEDGIVTAGSAAAIAIATAAAIAENDPVRMLRLPLTDGMPNEVVMLKSHRFPYDQAIRMVGARIIEVKSLHELHALDFSSVVMFAYLGSRDINAEIQLEEFVSIGRCHNIPVLVDAASEHIERPNKWLNRGADLVVYSGGKVLRGPQTSGLLLGRKDLIAAAWANSPPHRAFGRPMKIGKEDVIGVIAALEAWFSRDISSTINGWTDDLETIARITNGSPGVSSEILPPDEGDKVPLIRINWDYSSIPIHGLELRHRLLEGEPRILLDEMSAGPGTITIEVFSLQPGEARIVGESISTALKELKAVVMVELATVQISGTWDFEVMFSRWPRKHQVTLVQNGDKLCGQQVSSRFEGSVTGSVNGNEIYLVFEDNYEGAIITYHFTGVIDGENMTGDVMLGSTTPHTRGEVSYTQYGKVLWHARQS